MLGNAIYNILSNASGVTNLVGTDIFPVQAPKNTNAPFVVYRINNTEPTQQKDGASPIDQEQVQVDTYAKTYTGAHSIATAIRSALDDYSGTAASIVIRHIWFEDQDDGDFTEDLGFYAISQIYEVKRQR